MNDQPNREESIFDAAVELATAEERAAYIVKACGEDATLRQKVEDLLRAHEQAGAFLETSAAGDLPKPALAAGIPAIRPDGTTLVTLTEKSGDTIGRYKLLQAIGEGGCGVVYMAEQQEPVRRRVALKIIRLGMDTKSVIARFEAERQALAMMDHPNIAKVLDAGATDTGRPYFVMELVRGIRVTEYCDQHNLPTEERLKLFIQICRAIQHAHQKGVIHRDIKPSNILVTLHDGIPVPKVIDFGIAKATDQRLTDKTLFTEFKSFIGTPAYVSPEQAEMSGLDIDTRSDVYSLGVLLYELLTGKTPFDPVELMRASLDEMRRTIRETEPVRPSTCLSTMIDSELTTTALRHRVEAPKLISRIRGDLDWIVMKCLEKDRTRRYETTTLLAMDVERYLNQEPVFARPPSKVYQLQKLVRRNKAAFIGASAVAAALIAGLIASTWLFFRERDARKDAVVAEKEQTRLRGVAEQARSSEAKERERAEFERRVALRTAYNSDMNLIPQAIAANNFGRTVDLLNRHRPKKTVEGQNELRVEGKETGNRGPSLNPQPTQPSTDLRQWEWRYFWNQFRSDAAFALPKQSNSVTAVTISPDGRFLISSGMPGTLKLWDLFRRSEVATFREGGSGPGPFGSSANFAFSPKGDRLAAVVNEGQGPRRTTMVKIWAVPTHEITAEFPHEGGVQSLAFSSDGTKLFTAGQDFGQDMTVRVWDLASQQIASQSRIRLQGEGFRRRTVLFSRDAKRLAIGDDEGRIHLVDTSTGAERSNVAAFESAIAAIAFSPEGDLLAATSFVTETDIKLFNVETGAAAGTLEGHASWVPGLTFTADGKRLISAGADQTVRIWDVKEHRELNALRGHWSEINCVAITPDGGTIISGCKDGTLFGWDAQRIERRKQFETLPSRISSIEFLPQNQAMLSVNADETVSVWDSATLQESERLSTLGNRIRRIVVSPDGGRIYAGTPDGEIRVLDWATRSVITNLASASRGFSNRPRPMDRGFSFGPIGLLDNGRTLLAGGAGGTIRLWDTATWQPKGEWKAGDGRPFHRMQLIISPDERFLLMSGFGGAIEFHNIVNGQTEATLPVQNWGTSGMAFSPDGNVLATSSGEGTVNLWDVANRSVTDVLRGHLLGVHSVAFSPDGHRIASGSHGNEAVKLWDIVTHQEVATLAGQGSMFEFVKFSPGGKMLVAINRQGTAHIWRAPSLAEIEAAEKTQVVAGP